MSALALLVFGSPAHAAPSEQDLINQINAKSKQFEKVVQQYDGIKDDIKKSKKDLKALRKRLKPMEAKVATAQRKVSAIASAAYRGDKANALNSVLKNGSASTLLESMSMLNQMARSQNEQISTLLKAKRQLDAQKNKLSATAAKQEKQKKALAAKKSSLDKQVKKLRQMRIDVYGPPVDTSNVNYGPPPGLPGSAGQAVDYAWGALGKPYYYGAAGPNSYDCSGLTMAAWSSAGYSLPHNAASQYNATARISRNDLQAGDLVFYNGLNHVAIFIGGSTIIHAPTEGQPVQKANIDSMSIVGYGRVH